MNDLRAAVRALVKNPLFTAVSVITLALGIGANSTLFTIVNAVLLRRLPYPSADRIMSVTESMKGEDRHVASLPRYAEWSEAARSFEAWAEYRAGLSVILTGAGDPEQLSGTRTSAGFFSLLGARPATGRLFTAADEGAGAPAVIVVSDRLRVRAFGADGNALGRTITLDGKPFTVIGVMPADFAMPRGAMFWLPEVGPSTPGAVFFASVLGRLKPGVSVADAQAELAMITRRGDPQRFERDRGTEPVVMSLHDRLYGETRGALVLLFGAVTVLLLIACANVANLQLARAAARRKEFTIRVTLGAGWRHIVRQLLCESLLISLIGGALGLLIPVWTLGFIVRVSPRSVAGVQGIHVDGAVLAFTFTLSVITGLLFGLAPAIGAARVELGDALKEGGSRATSTRGQNRLRRALILGELATSLVLLTGAGLFMKSFSRAVSVDPVLRPERLLIAEIYPARTRYPDAQSSKALFDDIAGRVGALPGVQSAAYAGVLPLGGFQFSFPATRSDGVVVPEVGMIVVGTNLFHTLGIPLVEGREFTAADGRGAPAVAVISEAAAHALFPDGHAVGGEIAFKALGNPRVVGVVKDVPAYGVDAAPRALTYMSAQQSEEGLYTLAIRTTGDPSALETAVRHVVSTVDPSQPIRSFTTMEHTLSEFVAPRRFNFMLIGILALLALALAAIGLYGVMAYLVEQRTHEIGIRVALGAARRSVVWLVVRQGMMLAAIGIAIGSAGSLASVRLLRGMLYHVSIYDPWTFGGVAGLLAIVALLASYLPARRATKVDPIVALRAE